MTNVAPLFFSHGRGRRGRGRGRGRGHAIKRRRVERTEEEQAEAQAMAEHLEKNRLNSKYVRRLQCKLMVIVEHMMDWGHDNFLKTAEMEAGGWELPYQLDLTVIEADPKAFYKELSVFLSGLKHHKNVDEDDKALPQLHGTIRQYITAVNSCWRDINKPVPPLFMLLCAKFMVSVKKKEKELKSKGIVRDGKGREEMQFILYRELSWYFLRKGMMFQHLFLILCWNTMVRCCNCDDIVFPNCLWEGDAFGVSVKRSKTNPDGRRDVQTDTKHLYANKYMPEVCPILGLALYFLTNPFIGGSSSKKFFPGKDTHKSFNEAVTAALQDPELTRRLDNLGIPYRNVGAYSTRKGSTTYCTTGTTAGPPIIAVLLRAGWTIGKTLESYLRQAQAGDTFCGRVVCGLPVLHKNFAALPPHFKLVEGADWGDLQATLKMAYPFHESWGPSFQPVVYFMLASLTYHQEWIRSELDVAHVVRGKANLWDRLHRLHALLETDDDKSRLTVTGVPPHSIIFGNIHRVEENVQRLEGKVDRLQVSVDGLPGKLKDCMKAFYHEKDVENGMASASVVKDMMDRQMEQMRQLIHTEVSTISGVVHDISDSLHEEPTPTQTTPSLPRRGGGIWFWSHGPCRYKKYSEQRARYLPKEFRLSFDLTSRKRLRTVDCTGVDITRKKVNAFDAWTWWWEGLRYGDNVIRPLKNMADDPKFHFYHKNARQRYNDLKSLVLSMVELLQNAGVVDAVEDENTPTKRLLFKQGFKLMEAFINKHHPAHNDRRLSETMSFTTLKKDFYLAKKQHTLQQKLDHFVDHLSQIPDGDYFLKDTDSGKQLDFRKFQASVKDFYSVFSSFLMTVPRESMKIYVQSVNGFLTSNGRVLPFYYKNMISKFV